LEIEIISLCNKIFTLRAEGERVQVSEFIDPVTVALTIGNDMGSTAVAARFERKETEGDHRNHSIW
jgi:hypothetical protein